MQAGFAEVAVGARELVANDGWQDAVALLAGHAAGLLNEGRSVILHTARGPDDPRIGAMLDALADQ